MCDLSLLLLANDSKAFPEPARHIIFRPRQKRQTFDIKVTLSNRDITQVKETVFLEVILDEHLTWTPHITDVARKVSKAVGVMYKASFCLSKP